MEPGSKVVWDLALQWYGTQSNSGTEPGPKVVWGLALGFDSLNSRSFARAWRTREAPMRLERAADSVAANTPTVMRGGTTLMSYRGRKRRESIRSFSEGSLNSPGDSCSCSAAVLSSR